MSARTERRHKRARINVRMHIRGEQISGDVWFDVSNISEGGVYLISDFLFDKDTPMLLEFELPGAGECSVNGRVAWVNLGVEDSLRDHPFGMGIEFEADNNSIREKIARFISERGEEDGRDD